MRWRRTWRIGTGQESLAIVTAIYRLAGGKSMLDLGCGRAPFTHNLTGATWVDVVSYPDAPRGILQMDMRNAPEFFAKRKQRFDLVLLTDSIEHILKNDGLFLLDHLPAISGGTLIFTPIGDLWRTEDQDPNSHKSGWAPEELWADGWTIWEWPIYHRFSDTSFHGSFWAWRFGIASPEVEVVSNLSGVLI